MNFGFTEEQDLLRAEVRKFLDARCPLEQVRTVMESERGYSPELWASLAELGWLGLTIPEAHGGAGLGWVDFVVLLEETGRSLFPSPLVSTTLAAAAILDSGSEEQKARWLPGIAAVTAGPGVTNTLTAVKNAQLAQSPVVLLGGATATVLRGRGALAAVHRGLILVAPSGRRVALAGVARRGHAAHDLPAQRAVRGKAQLLVDLGDEAAQQQALARPAYAVRIGPNLRLAVAASARDDGPGPRVVRRPRQFGGGGLGQAAAAEPKQRQRGERRKQKPHGVSPFWTWPSPRPPVRAGQPALRRPAPNARRTAPCGWNGVLFCPKLSHDSSLGGRACTIF